MPIIKYFQTIASKWPVTNLSAKHGLPLGIIKINGVRNCNMPKESDLKKDTCGAMLENVSTIDDISSMLVWPPSDRYVRAFL